MSLKDLYCTRSFSQPYVCYPARLGSVCCSAVYVRLSAAPLSVYLSLSLALSLSLPSGAGVAARELSVSVRLCVLICDGGSFRRTAIFGVGCTFVDTLCGLMQVLRFALNLRLRNTRHPNQCADGGCGLKQSGAATTTVAPVAVFA